MRNWSVRVRIAFGLRKTLAGRTIAVGGLTGLGPVEIIKSFAKPTTIELKLEQTVRDNGTRS